MILLDYNQVAISNLMAIIAKEKKKNEFDENLVRHMVLNSIRLYMKKYRGQFGELVICCDARRYWRKDVFEFYKGNRKADRDKSKWDWKKIMKFLNMVQDELKENFPYKVLKVDGAEADDIIGYLCNAYGDKGPYIKDSSNPNGIMIISGDKDFAQLQKYKNVFQYSPMTKKNIVVKDPERFLQEHILRGDSGDGVPNILSTDDCLVDKNQRQNPLLQSKVDGWVKLDPKEYCSDTMLSRWHRNNGMVNLDMVPKEINDRIKKEFEECKVPSRAGLLNFFIQKGLNNLIRNLGEF